MLIPKKTVARKLTPAGLIIFLALYSCGAGVDRLGSSRQDCSSPSTREEGQTQETRSIGASPTLRAGDPNKFALIIAGVGGEEIYSRKFTDQARRLYEALTGKLGFDAKNVTLLTEAVAEEGEQGQRDNFGRSTAEEVGKALDSIKARAAPQSSVLIVLIGHGSSDTQHAKFNLLGPDLTAKDYAAALSSLPAELVIFVNCASASGDFVKALSGPGRIVITATRSGNEQNATIFADHFIAALTSDSADADKNGRVSVLEAFNYATQLTAEWYRQNNRLATEHALIDDNGDGVGREQAIEGEGALARTSYFDSKPLEEAGGDQELKGLLDEKSRLEQSVEALKVRKSQMKPEDYEIELERLLVELAGVNQRIRARQK